MQSSMRFAFRRQQFTAFADDLFEQRNPERLPESLPSLGRESRFPFAPHRDERVRRTGDSLQSL